MQAWQATVQNEQGNVVFNPSVTVYLEDGVTLAPIFNEDGSPKANPFTGSLEGFVQFWADDGEYVIEGATGSDTTELWYISLVSSPPPFESGTVKDLTTLLSSDNGYDVGDIILTRDEGYSLEVVSSDPDFTTAAGVFLKRVRTDELAVAAEKSTRGGSTSDVLSIWQGSAPHLWSKLERIKPEWGGAVGDKTSATDTTSALNAAASYAAQTGKILHLERGAAYATDSQLILPAGLRIENDGAVFHPQYAPVDGDEPIISVGGDVVADRLLAHLDAGIGTIGHMFIFNSGGSFIGRVSATSDDLIADGSVTSGRISGAVVFQNSFNINVDQIRVDNFLNGWMLYKSSYVTVGQDRVTNCRKGFTWNVVDNCHLRSGVSEHFPKLIRQIGDLGFIGAGVKNSSISNRVVIDCGEHAFRLGGNSLYNDLIADGETAPNALNLATSDNFTLSDCKAIRPLGCAFKTQPGAVVTNNDIKISGLYAEDVDNGKGGGTNSDFIRLVSSTNITVSDCVNNNVGQSYSGSTGIRVEGCDKVFTDNLELGPTANDGCFFTTANPDGGTKSVNEMRLEFSTRSNSANGFRFTIGANGDTIRRFTADMEVFNAAVGMKIEARPDGSTPLGGSSLMWLKGYVADCATNKDVAAAYTGVRFQDNVSVPL